MNPGAAFLDRDGVINDLVYYPDFGEWESPRDAGALAIIEGAAEALRQLTQGGWRLFLVSNQPSFAKGKTTLENLKSVHTSLAAQLAKWEVVFTDTFYCYHHPDGIVPSVTGACLCRKPKPGSLVQAAAKYDVDLGASWMVGDQDTDIDCGIAAGTRTILVPNPHSAAKRGHSKPTAVAPDLKAAVQIIFAT